MNKEQKLSLIETCIKASKLNQIDKKELLEFMQQIECNLGLGVNSK